MKKEIQIIPTVMPNDYDDLIEKIDFVRHAVSFVNIDVMDGKFVPSRSWPYADSSHFNKMMQQEEGLPHWQDLDFSVDLMVADPQTEVPKWIEIGVSEVIIHIESLASFGRPESQRLPEFISGSRNDSDKIPAPSGGRQGENEGRHKDDAHGVGFIKKLKEEGIVKVTLAINPDTSNKELEKYKGLYDSVQFMGIEKIGYQGQPFVLDVLDKIREFKKQYPDIPIMIDGGVSEDTIKDLYEAGVTKFSAGSAIFEEDDAKEAIKNLKFIVNS